MHRFYIPVFHTVGSNPTIPTNFNRDMVQWLLHWSVEPETRVQFSLALPIRSQVVGDYAYLFRQGSSVKLRGLQPISKAHMSGSNETSAMIDRLVHSRNINYQCWYWCNSRRGHDFQYAVQMLMAAHLTSNQTEGVRFPHTAPISMPLWIMGNWQNHSAQNGKSLEVRILSAAPIYTSSSNLSNK